MEALWVLRWEVWEPLTLEEEMATHSSILAWSIPGLGEPGGLSSMGSHRVGHNWGNLAAAAASKTSCVYWMGFPGGASGKEPAWPCRRCKRHVFDPWVGKILWRRASSTLACRIPMNRGAPRAIVHGVSKSRTRLKQLISMHVSIWTSVKKYHILSLLNKCFFFVYIRHCLYTLRVYQWKDG